jgi:hypothetical protein
MLFLDQACFPKHEATPLQDEVEFVAITALEKNGVIAVEVPNLQLAAHVNEVDVQDLFAGFGL